MHPRSPWEELGDVHALAFAHDAGTEEVLREVLAGCADHEVRSGGAREAVAALRDGDAAVPRLLVVDLDTVGYVGGVLHELSAVCSSDTVVVALSSERSARLSREMFLCGVADHLVKPLEPETVGALLVQAVRRGHDGSVEGCLVGASGTGGSGTTTLVAAVALRAVRRGRRVSLVDLSRGFSTLAFLLDIDPPAGLDALLSADARSSEHPDFVERVAAQVSDRLELHAYPWSPECAPIPPAWAVCELCVALQRRSHLVIVDGIDDPALQQAILAMADVRLLSVENTAVARLRALSLVAGLGPFGSSSWPSVVVSMATRPGRARGGPGLDAAVGHVPYLPDLVDLAAHGWLRGSVPAPLAAVADVVLDRLALFGPMAYLSPSASVATDAARATDRSALLDRVFTVPGRALRRLRA